MDLRNFGHYAFKVEGLSANKQQAQSAQTESAVDTSKEEKSSIQGFEEFIKTQELLTKTIELQQKQHQELVTKQEELYKLMMEKLRTNEGL